MRDSENLWMWKRVRNRMIRRCWTKISQHKQFSVIQKKKIPEHKITFILTMCIRNIMLLAKSNSHIYIWNCLYYHPNILHIKSVIKYTQNRFPYMLQELIHNEYERLFQIQWYNFVVWPLNTIRISKKWLPPKANHFADASAK